LPANYTFTAADQGCHTFTATLNTPGIQSITATDTVDPAITGTCSTTVQAPPCRLVWINFPAFTMPGVPFSFTICVERPDNSICTDYTGTIHFTSTDPGAILPPDYTYSPSDMGCHVFTVTLNTIGTQCITATDTVDSTITGTCCTEVQGPCHLVWLNFPSSTRPDVPFMFTVCVVAPDGELCTNYRGTIHCSSTDPSAQLPADYTFTAADNGCHTFTATLNTPGIQSITATDVNDDTITGTCSTTVQGPCQLNWLDFPTSVTAGNPFAFMICVVDSFGNLCTDYRGTIHFTSTDPLAQLPADYTFTAADNGCHTFTATLKTPGMQCITATDTIDSSVTGTCCTNVQGPCQFVWLDFPANATAGTPFTFTICAVAPDGSLCTSYRGTIHFTSTDPQATLPPNYTFTAADNGCHTFTATLNTVGIQCITGTDTVDPSITGTCCADVESRCHLVWLQFPASVTAGVPFSFTVCAVDSSGNLCTDYRGTIHFSSTDPFAQLPADYTFTAADDGCHNFIATLNTPGTQSITATEVNTPQINSTCRTEVHGACALVWMNFPTTVQPGMPFSFTVCAVAPDGTLCTDYRGTIHFSSTDPMALLPADYTFTAADNGCASFTATLFLPGVQCITATDVNDPSITGTCCTDVSNPPPPGLPLTPFLAAPTVPAAVGPLANWRPGTPTGSTNLLVPAPFGPVNQSGTVSVLLGNGNGTFESAVTYGAGPNTVDLVAGDFSGDGVLDSDLWP
jgi:hypothetical protein